MLSSHYRNSFFTVWLLFLLTLATANFALPQVIRHFIQASDCYQTDSTKSYGYAPTGRPCPNPQRVAVMPYSTPQTTEKGFLPHLANLQNTSLVNSLLYLATFPFFLFSVLAIVGTVILWFIIKLKR